MAAPIIYKTAMRVERADPPIGFRAQIIRNVKTVIIECDITYDIFSFKKM
jgi:hypothetical protein